MPRRRAIAVMLRGVDHREHLPSASLLLLLGFVSMPAAASTPLAGHLEAGGGSFAGSVP